MAAQAASFKRGLAAMGMRFCGRPDPCSARQHADTSALLKPSSSFRFVQKSEQVLLRDQKAKLAPHPPTPRLRLEAYHVVTKPELDPVFFKKPHFLEGDDFSVTITLGMDNLVLDFKMPNPSINGVNPADLPDIGGQWWPFSTTPEPQWGLVTLMLPVCSHRSSHAITNWT